MDATAGCYCLGALAKLLFSPLLGILLLAVLPTKFARTSALFSATITLILGILLTCKYSVTGGMQFVESHSWFPALGVRFVLGVDGISLPLVLLLSTLFVFVVLGSREVKQAKGYYALLMFLQLGALGCFLSLEGIAFFVFWELVLIPLYLLIAAWGEEGSGNAAMGFLLYTGLGSLLMLAAIIYLGMISARSFGGTPTYLFTDWQQLSFGFKEELWLLSAFLFAFLVKVPVFPLHSWLPPVISKSPKEVSILLVGTLFQMGLYGLLRVCVAVFPGSFASVAPLLAVLGVLGVVYGGLVAWAQTDLKNLIAYSSVGHLGLCLFGLASVNIYGMSGAVIQMIMHGVAAATVYFLVDLLVTQRGSSKISDFGGLASRIPATAMFTFIFVLCYIGLPTTGGFVGEFVLMTGGFKFSPGLMIIGVTGIVIGAVYMLSAYRRIFFGAAAEGDGPQFLDLSSANRLLLIPFVIAVFFIGLFPRPLLEVVEPAVKRVLFGFEAEVGRAQISKQNDSDGGAV